MPQLIEHIDAIARQKGRDVLYLEFHPHDDWRRYRYETDPMRDMILRWLDQHEVGWQTCGPYARPGCNGPYLGQIYLDVPFDESLPAYRSLRDYLELPNGSMRHDGVRFYAMPLAYANQNAEHDAPGFWERFWADF
jgi:hypothetical protein